MTPLAAAAAVAFTLSAGSGFAQANGNLPPGAVANGSGATPNTARGVQPNGRMREGAAGVGDKTATNGQNMRKGDTPAVTKPAP